MKNIFSFISKQIIHTLDPHHKCSEIQYFQMYYGVQILLYNIIVTSFILISSYFWKCFAETCLVFAVFGTLRLIAGGFHFNSILKCSSVTALIMLGGGKYVSITSLNFPFCLMLCIFANIIFFIHTPKGTHKNPYSQEYSRMQKKRLSIVTAILSIISFFSEELRTGMVIPMFFVAIFLLPEIIRKFRASA